MKSLTTRISIDDYWSESIQLLKSVGFEYYDRDHYLAFDVESIDYTKDDIVLIEKEHGRNMFVFVLSPDGGFQLYVRSDVGMGFNILELRWSEIEFEWLDHLKKGIQGQKLTYQP